MAAPLDPRDVDDAIRLYLAGKTLDEITSATGVSSSALHRARTAQGVPPRSRAKTVVDPAIVVSDYLDGLSEFAVAGKHGCSRTLVRRILKESSVEIRGQSEAGILRSSKMTPEQRRAQAIEAHKASRGSRRSESSLIRAARTRERTGRLQSVGEVMLYHMLIASGLDPVPQKAIRRHNVDMAVGSVAVEILGGGWHLKRKAMHAKRSKDILDAGWHLVMIWDHEGVSTLRPGAAQYLVAFLDELRRNPPAQCQYRMIGGDGHLLAACGADCDELPFVPPPRGRQHLRS